MHKHGSSAVSRSEMILQQHLSPPNRRAQLFPDTETKAKAIPQPPLRVTCAESTRGTGETCAHCLRKPWQREHKNNPHPPASRHVHGWRQQQLFVNAGWSHTHNATRNGSPGPLVNDTAPSPSCPVGPRPSYGGHIPGGTHRPCPGQATDSQNRTSPTI